MGTIESGERWTIITPNNPALYQNSNGKQGQFEEGFNFTPYVLGLGIFVLVLTIYAGSRIKISDRHLIPISVYAGIFALNFSFQILPRHVAIWAVFVIFPYILVFIQQLGETQGRR